MYIPILRERPMYTLARFGGRRGAGESGQRARRWARVEIRRVEVHLWLYVVHVDSGWAGHNTAIIRKGNRMRSIH